MVDQVWSLNQFYSVNFLLSRINVSKCLKETLFYKRTIKVCVSCFCQCSGTSAPGLTQMTVSKVEEAPYEASQGLLKGAMSAQKSSQGSIPKTSKLLEGTEVKSVPLGERSLLYPLGIWMICFPESQQGKMSYSKQTWGGNEGTCSRSCLRIQEMTHCWSRSADAVLPPGKRAANFKDISLSAFKGYIWPLQQIHVFRLWNACYYVCNV